MAVSLKLLEDLSRSEFENLLPVLIADDSGTQIHDYYGMDHFEPCSFTLEERKQGLVGLDTEENDFSIWIEDFIKDFISRSSSSYSIFQKNKAEISRCVKRNVLFLLSVPFRGKTVASLTYNQEAPDLIAKVCLFTLGIDASGDADTHAEFNQIAFEVIPQAIERMNLHCEPSLGVLLRFAIASGLCGLDLKGAVAASSGFAQAGIPMKMFLSRRTLGSDIDAFCSELIERANGPVPLFYLEHFLADIALKNCRVSWFTDDVIESFFDLLFIQRLLLINDSVSFVVIPKRGKYSNDLSWAHLEDMLQLPIFLPLRGYCSSGRFSWTKSGPRMSAINLGKLDTQVRGVLQKSDVAVIKGCRAHEMVQGGLDIVSYTGYVVARRFSEKVSGFDAASAPLLFFRLAPREYAFYGFPRAGRVRIRFDGGRRIEEALCTTRDHFKRRQIVAARDIMNEFVRVMSEVDSLSQSDKKAAVWEANDLAEKLVEVTRQTYNRIADDYAAIRWEEPHDLDKQLWRRMIYFAEENIRKGVLHHNSGPLRLLDIGTGNGRDLKYAQNSLGLHAVGIDNSNTFVKRVKELEEQGKVRPGSIFLSDMRELSIFENSPFDIVRHNASMLHMPVVALGHMADKAISESYRVLKPGGILYVFVKKGRGVDLVDTGEGLGERFYQFFDSNTLDVLLSRNGFRVLEISEETEIRGEKRIPWLALFATK